MNHLFPGILLIFLPFILQGQYSPLPKSASYISEVQEFSTNEGLSSDEVFALHKGPKGFMWIGTQYGLNRFDGNEFEVFTSENTIGLTFNRINRILVDQANSNKLWLVYTHGKYEHTFTDIAINIFDIETQEAQDLATYLEEPLPFNLNDLSYIQQTSDHSIFFHSKSLKKAFTYHRKSGFKSFPIPKKIRTIHGVRPQKNGHFLVAGDFGDMKFCLARIDQDGKIIKEHQAEIYLDIGNKEKQTTERFPGWVGSNLAIYDFIDPLLELKGNNDFWEIGDLIEQTVFNEQEQLFWLKKGGQIMVITPEGELIYSFDDELENLGLNPYLFDGTTTWTSNRKYGLKAITLQQNHFTNHQFFPNIVDNSMRGVIIDQEENLWFSTINELGKQSTKGAISLFGQDKHFTGYLEDSDGNIWYHVYGKLIKYMPDENRSITFPFAPYTYVWSIFETESGHIWLNSGAPGFHIFNPDTGIFKEIKFSGFDSNTYFNIYSFEKRDDQSYWLATSQGLLVVDQDGKLLATYNNQQEAAYYLPAMDFHHIYTDKKGVIWLATGDGGLIYLPSKEEVGVKYKYKQLTTLDGLSSNSLHAVYEDDFAYLWISSDHGLMQVDKKTLRIVKFFEENGLLHNEFNRISHYQHTDGTLFFGGLYGLTSFHPKDFANTRDKIKPPQLAVTNFQQFSNANGAFEDRTRDLKRTNTITLLPGDQLFNLSLSLLDFTYNKNSIYQYKIEGLYDWQQTTNSHLIISGLPYGNHTLDIKARNGNRQEAANTLSFEVNVLKPFYLRWWFLVLALVAVSLVAWLIIRRRTKQLFLHQEAEQLRHVDKLKSRFFANISHELRTPITLILGPLTQLIENIEQSPVEEVKNRLLSVKSNGKNLLRLVNEILDLSRLEAGKLQLDQQTTELKPFLERVIGVFHSAAESRTIDYRYTSFIAEGLQANLDSGKLEMIINNLISNALKYTPKNGRISISTECTAQNRFIFKIQDNGSGIHPEDQPHIFKRFYQANGNRTPLEGGSGIGLAICQELVSLMDGAIEVKSKLGEGSTFTFEISLEIKAEQSPVSELIEPEAVESIPLPQVSHLLFSADKPTILIVEDHLELQSFIQELLQPVYNTYVASNGLAAIDILERNDDQLPDLIISDVMMPEMDGFTFLKKLKLHSAWCQIPFIMLTARADQENKLKALTIGVDDYLVKPFENKELMIRVKNLLTNARGRIAIPSEDQNFKQDAPSTENPNNFTPKDLEWIKQVEEIAKREINNNQYTFEHMAKELLISSRHMSRKIKQITGLSPSQYLREIKMQKARELIEQQAVRSVKELSFAVGFENPTYFAGLYEERFGAKPQFSSAIGTIVNHSISN